MYCVKWGSGIFVQLRRFQPMHIFRFSRLAEVFLSGNAWLLKFMADLRSGGRGTPWRGAQTKRGSYNGPPHRAEGEK